VLSGFSSSVYSGGGGDSLVRIKGGGAGAGAYHIIIKLPLPSPDLPRLHNKHSKREPM
jgi:hypothetical protein